MAYTFHDRTKMAIANTRQVGVDASRTNDAAIADALMAGHYAAWPATVTYSNSMKPTAIEFANGVERVKAAITWTSNKITSIALSYSSNSGSTYDTIATANYTFDANGITAVSGGGALATHLAINALYQALQTNDALATHMAGTGTGVHGLGSMATQAATAVAILGGTINGADFGSTTPGKVSATWLRESIINSGSISAGSYAPDYANAGYYRGVAAGNLTLAPVNTGVAGFVRCCAMAISKGANTLTLGAGWSWDGGVTPTFGTGYNIIGFWDWDNGTIKAAELLWKA